MLGKLLFNIMIIFTLITRIKIKGDLILPRQCEPIRIELCRGIGYNETSMPNLVGHELQSDADLTLQTFAPLIEYGCSFQLHFFLCSAYVPMCTSKVPNPIGPCKSLCEIVRERCHPVLQGFGFPWPAALDCNNFPVENNHEHMCMEGPGEPDGNIYTIGNSYSSIPISKISSKIQHQTNCHGLAKPHLYIRLNKLGRCAPLCEADILFDKTQKHLAEIWVSTWSYAALSIAIIATLCLIFSDTKWDQLLTPLVTCHTLVAIGWTIRFLSGRNAASCGYDVQLPNVSLLLIDGLSNASCAGTFLLRYYFGMATGVWWSVICLKWHCGVRQNCTDLIQPVPINTINGKINNKTNIKSNKKQTFSNLMQLAAWGLPALQTVAALVARLVDADELLGICYVGNQSEKGLKILVATPLSCYWIFGSVNLFAGYLVYRRQKFFFINQLPQYQVHNSIVNMDGVGTFLFVYSIPSAILLMSVFYEFANTDVWLNVPQFVGNNSMYLNEAPMWPFMMRSFMELLLGVLSSAWVLGPRISILYKLQFGKKCKQPSKKCPQQSLSAASYQTICNQPSTVSSNKILKYSQSNYTHPLQQSLPHQTYLSRHKYRNAYRTQSVNQYGNETIL